MAGGAQGTAISLAMDLKEGIVARFRTMSISRAAFLSGHVLGKSSMAAVVLVVVVALVIGFRPTTALSGSRPRPARLAALALTWLAVAMGMVTKSVEAASNLPMPLMLLPFFGSGFVPTDSMPDPLRWFADNQPFTPIIETLRRLLLGTAIGTSALLTLGWCAVIGGVGFWWSMRLYERGPTP